MRRVRAKNSREIVLVVISNRNDDHVLMCASEELKNNREIVVASVSNNGMALMCSQEHREV